MNLAPFLGLPFADKGRGPAYDCWGLVRHYLWHATGVLLPDYGHLYATHEDHGQVTDGIKAGLVEGWTKSVKPVLNGLVIFKIAGQPWHIGVVVSRDRFLHIPPGETSCTERFADPRWINRIEGFYVRG